VCTGHPFETLEERQKRRRQQITSILHALSSHLSRIGLKITTAQFETTTSNEHFDIVVNEPTPENDCISESVTASINYLMLKHAVPITFYHELTKRFKKLPRTYKVGN